MGITVEFKDFEEMVDFARQLIGGSVTATTGFVQPVQEAPTQQEAPQTNSAKGVPVQQSTSAPQTAPTTTNPVQTSTTDYTMDDLANAAMTLMDAGRQGDLLNLLAQFGVDALPSLPQEQFGAFATALRGLGAQI